MVYIGNYSLLLPRCDSIFLPKSLAGNYCSKVSLHPPDISQRMHAGLHSNFYLFYDIICNMSVASNQYDF